MELITAKKAITVNSDQLLPLDAVKDNVILKLNTLFLFFKNP